MNTDVLIDEWLEYEQITREASDATIKTYRRSMSIFLDWVMIELEKDLERVIPPDVEGFKSDLRENYSVQTVNLHLTAVRSFYKFCIVKGYLSVNPTKDVMGLKRSRSTMHKKDALSNTEIKDLLKQPDITTLRGLRDRAILILLSYCAMRSVEIHRANVEDLRTKDDRLILEVQGKKRIEKDEFVIIPIKQEKYIREYEKERLKISKKGPLFISLSNRTKNERIGLSSIRNIVKAYFAESGVIGSRKTTHSLRHSAISSAIDRGATPLQVQSMARHSDFNTTLIYYKERSRINNPAEDLIDYED